jgi:hypothetical protein
MSVSTVSFRKFNKPIGYPTGSIREYLTGGNTTTDFACGLGLLRVSLRRRGHNKSCFASRDVDGGRATIFFRDGIGQRECPHFCANECTQIELSQKLRSLPAVLPMLPCRQVLVRHEN